MKGSPYFKQAEFLLRILPIVNEEKKFALKGGTAINFFIRDVPRLSVDIDLTYLPINDRVKALSDISILLNKIANSIDKKFPESRCDRIDNDSLTLKLIIRESDLTVKIEPNQVIRGSVFSTNELELNETAQNLFEKSISVQSLSFEDLYGGKICAALDRQHPRDLFDIKLLMDNEGITDNIRKAFIVYLISHSRPISELLKPNLKDIKPEFSNEFIGMTALEITLEELENIRTHLIRDIRQNLTESERKFLLSVKRIEPEWNLLELDGIENLPAVRWKLQNLQNMKKGKHKIAINKLEKLLEL